jgi:hypothetical protein
MYYNSGVTTKVPAGWSAITRGPCFVSSTEHQTFLAFTTHLIPPVCLFKYLITVNNKGAVIPSQRAVCLFF